MLVYCLIFHSVSDNYVSVFLRDLKTYAFISGPINFASRESISSPPQTATTAECQHDGREEAFGDDASSTPSSGEHPTECFRDFDS